MAKVYLRRGDGVAKGEWILKWQAFLAEQGHFSAEPAAVFGPSTMAATKSFQKQCGISVDGAVGGGTTEVARALGFEAPWLEDSPAAAEPSAVGYAARDASQVDTSGCPWLATALEELGVAEVRGREDNPRIVEYHRATRLRGDQHDEVPWCASFVSWCLEAVGIEHTASARARSYEKWGEELSAEQLGPGALVVFWRGDNPAKGQGHVGFYVGGDPSSGRILVLGGNQKNRVQVQTYGTKRVLSYRWPLGMARPSETQVQLAHAQAVGRAAAERWA